LRLLLSLLLLFLTAGLPQAQAQEFDRLYSKSIQPALSQPLQWASALATAAPSLPEGFIANPQVWTFSPYTPNTVLPTSTGRDVWVKFTLAPTPTPTPQSWIIRIQRVTVQKVSLYSLNPSGQWQFESAGVQIAPKDWSRTTRTPSFEVMTSSVEKSYFLRFEHHSPVTERPELMSAVDFADGASRVGTLIGLMIGMYGLLMLACFAAYAMARNNVFLWLAAFVVSLLMLNLIQMGYGGWRLWPGSVYTNQLMSWTVPLLAMATGSWFFAQASYAKDSNKTVYRLLVLIAIASLLLCLVRLVLNDAFLRHLLNNWAAFVLFTVVASLLWLSLRGMRWNLWLLAGLIPIAGSASTRLAYTYGWLAHIEFAQTASLFLTQLGLMWLFVALVWRSRDALLSTERAKVLENNDPLTGLTQQRVAKIRLQQMLKRAARLKLGCGVIMLRWVNYKQLMATQTPDKREALLRQMGQLLGRVVRDIDTAALLGEGYFMVLVEGPVNKEALASLSTQILTACIRLSEKLDMPNALDLHVAIWQAKLLPSTSAEVIEALQTRLNQMSSGTKRPVQFADSMNSSNPDPEDEFVNRRDELIAKIDALEASPSLNAPLARYPDKK
jgi:two-component system, sensor histidine kinase LadS